MSGVGTEGRLGREMGLSELAPLGLVNGDTEFSKSFIFRHVDHLITGVLLSTGHGRIRGISF